MIGELIKAWRKEHRHGTRALAKVLGISAATLNRIEHGQPIDGDTQLKLINWTFSKRKKQE
jgi:transcriptional regulator with XRE-family HTH domain